MIKKKGGGWGGVGWDEGVSEKGLSLIRGAIIGVTVELLVVTI